MIIRYILLIIEKVKGKEMYTCNFFNSKLLESVNENFFCYE